MFSHEEIDIAATIQVATDNLITVYNVTNDGLNMDVLGGKGHYDLRMSLEDVELLMKVLGEAKKHIEENR